MLILRKVYAAGTAFEHSVSTLRDTGFANEEPLKTNTAPVATTSPDSGGQTAVPHRFPFTIFSKLLRSFESCAIVPVCTAERTINPAATCKVLKYPLSIFSSAYVWPVK